MKATPCQGSLNRTTPIASFAIAMMALSSVSCGEAPTPTEELADTTERQTLFVSKTGNDATGDGSASAPFGTIRRALQELPLDIVGTRYVIDCTGLGMEQVGADGLFLPPYQSAGTPTFVSLPTHPAFGLEGALTLRAQPTVLETIESLHIVSQAQQPVHRLQVITVEELDWTADQWKGKLVWGSGVSEFATVAGNTPTTLEVTTTGTLTPPIRIGEPSCELRNSVANSFMPALGAMGMSGSLVVAGLRLSHANPIAAGLLFESEAIASFHAIDSDGLTVIGGHSKPVFRGSHFRGGIPVKEWQNHSEWFRQMASSGGYAIYGSLVEDLVFDAQGASAATSIIGTSVIDGCAHLGETPHNDGYDGTWSLRDTAIRRSRTHGFHASSGPASRLKNVVIDDSVGNAVHADGAGSVELIGVKGSGSDGYGIRAVNGAQVRLEWATDVSGLWGDMKVGARPPRSWTSFHTECPLNTEVDQTPAIGDGSRVFQKEGPIYACGASCNDGALNGNETDIDCGGGSPCPTCGLGKKCNATSDCVAGTCVAHRCVPQSWSRWVQLNPAQSPPQRIEATATYDPDLQRVLVAYGRSGLANSFYNDVWAWNGTTWSQLSVGGPSPRSQHMAAYSPQLGRVMLFGGHYYFPQLLNDSWSFTGTSWQTVPAAGTPPARDRPGFAYDQKNQVFVMFGGNPDGQPPYDETWTFNGAKWVKKNPVNKPPARRAPAMVYDTVRKRVVLFGGSAAANDSILLDDTWEWDGTNWTQKNPALKPAPRAVDNSPSAVIATGAPMMFDTHRGRAVLSGFRTGVTQGDTWEWDGTNWTRMVNWDGTGTNHPYVPQSPQLAYDASRRRGVMFNGRLTGWGAKETWEYYALATACSSASDCPTGTFCADGLCCESACTGTCQSCATVASPGRCAVVQNGKDDSCGGICDADGQCQ